MSKLLIALTLVGFTACSHIPYYQKLSSGQTGCDKKDIQISNLDETIGADTWVATCAKVSHLCTLNRSLGFGGVSSQSVNCKEATPEQYSKMSSGTPTPKKGAVQY